MDGMYSGFSKRIPAHNPGNDSSRSAKEWDNEKTKDEHMETLFPFFVGKPYAAFVLTAFWSAVCFLCGAYIGHRFTIAREVRKEFNAVADPIRAKIRNHQRIIARGQIPNRLGDITVVEYDALIDITSRMKRKALAEAWDRYKDACQNCGSIERGGSYNFHSPEVLNKALDGLMPFVQRR
ncbi:hypothetical protein QRZ34_23650 [Klebsiella michiganensis]|jgi:hypothetical protein|uniref:hypothetical protein n=1 Tax=Klebsiella michiganensis TaxID=1134687 RepID=UPI002113DEC3|nr:hypothetical protein [Klebsiella michiganensis]MDL4454050.1 hypothetical protein [Klebsiella michiganensis]HBM3269736.1 hypothetical protein [Klebsiella michiganensis]